jgi:hypothetical protein
MRKIAGLAALALIVGVMANAALAQGRGPQGPLGEIVATAHPAPTTSLSPGYANPANVVDSVQLGRGEWKVSASGATNFGGDAQAPNCGLVAEAEDGTRTLFAKQNFARGIDVGRSGFAIVGATTGRAEAQLVCHGLGPGNSPFEYNIAAIRGQ